MSVITYIKESFEELKNHVTWTPWAEAQNLTIVVAVFSIIFSLFVWIVDMAFGDLISGGLFEAFTNSEVPITSGHIRNAIIIALIAFVVATQTTKKK